MAIDRKAHQQNRKSWNAATRAHRTHRPRQASYFLEGGSTLFEEEMNLLGDVADREVAHLMCNAGQDSISLARLGASVTGVDISDSAIEEGRELAAATDSEVDFVRSDVYDWLAKTTSTFEVAFSSYGIVPWLSDLEAWAAGIEGILSPGGAFVLVDFHPVAVLFDESMTLSEPYAGTDRFEFDDGVGDYVAQSGETMAPGGFEPGETFDNPESCIEFSWTLSDVIQALVDAGLSLETFDEYPFSNGWRMFDSLVRVDERRWGFPDGQPNLPLMFGLKVTKPPANPPGCK